MNADLPAPLADLRVDGGMARSDPFLQFQADLLGLPLRRSPQAESTALGAALLAGLGVGLWPDPDDRRRPPRGRQPDLPPRPRRRLAGRQARPLAPRRRDRQAALPHGAAPPLI